MKMEVANNSEIQVTSIKLHPEDHNIKFLFNENLKRC